MLFPKCAFNILTTDGKLTAGRVNRLALELRAPTAIPRATVIYLKFGAAAWCGYGSGKNRSVANRTLLERTFHLPLAPGGLPAGTSTFPFALDLPAWMPDAYAGNDCGIHITTDARLDVDWALDPHATFAPRVVQEPRAALRDPLFLRSDASFHKDFVVELALDSNNVVSGDRLRGTIALRGGADKRFDGVFLRVNSLATAVFSHMTQRTRAVVSLRIPADALRAGNPVPFEIPIDASFPLTMSNGIFDVRSLLEVTVDIPWAFDPSLSVPFDVLPVGSQVHGERGASVLGSARVAGLAAHVATALGVPNATPPQVFAARLGLVVVSLTDTTREGRVGTTVRFDYPDLNLGFESHEMGLLDGFRDSTVLPPGLHERYWIDVRKPRQRPELGSVRDQFVKDATAGLGNVESFCISSHHLSWFAEYWGNEAEFVERMSRIALDRAVGIHHAASNLPPPPAAAKEAGSWRRAAEGLGLTAPPLLSAGATEAAQYVPSVPAILGLRFDARVQGGETRTFVLSLSTEWHGSTAADARTVLSFVPQGFVFGTKRDGDGIRQQSVDATHPLLSRVRELFPETLHAHANELRVSHPGLSQDPAAALGLLDALIYWALETRNERRADAPYR